MVPIYVFSVLFYAGIADAGSGRIVGGQDTTIDKYPSIVQVEFWLPNEGLWSQNCGASILTTFFLLSAAHCFYGSLALPEYRRIRAGTTYRERGGSVHYVDYYVNHPEYNLAAVLDADINIFRLRTPVVYSPVIQKATIVSHGDVIPDNLEVVLAGWGFLEGGGSSSDILQDTTVKTINQDICRQRYSPLPITDYMLCSGLLDIGGRGACHGDSGGPLYFRDMVIGVISWGVCAHPTYPGVTVRVSEFTNWIVDNAR